MYMTKHLLAKGRSHTHYGSRSDTIDWVAKLGGDTRDTRACLESLRPGERVSVLIRAAHLLPVAVIQRIADQVVIRVTAPSTRPDCPEDLESWVKSVSPARLVDIARSVSDDEEFQRDVEDALEELDVGDRTTVREVTLERIPYRVY